MPTVILLDCSVSLARRLGSLQVTRQELIQRAVLDFLQLLELHQPIEYTALVSFSSSSKIVCDFTQDYGLLRKSLFDMQLEDKTLIQNGFLQISHLVTKIFGTETVCQIVLVCDGTPNDAELPFTFPFPARIHAVTIGNKNEVDTEFFKSFVKSDGDFHFLELPTQHDLIKVAFRKIVEKHYCSYVGSLACGYINCKIILYPNPNIQLQNEYKNTFPTTLSIIGFLPISQIPSPESLSHHVILPENFYSKSEIGNFCFDCDQFCYLLNDCLKQENVVAVVYLSKNWYGIINSILHADSYSCLSFVVLPKNFKIPVLGKISDLIPDSVTVPPMDSQKNFELEIPRESNCISYIKHKSKNILPSISEDSLTMDCQKIIKYASILPTKVESLYKECEKLRYIALIFNFPDLINKLIELLKVQLGSETRETRSASLLKILITDLKETPLNEPLTSLNELGSKKEKTINNSSNNNNKEMSLESQISNVQNPFQDNFFTENNNIERNFNTNQNLNQNFNNNNNEDLEQNYEDQKIESKPSVMNLTNLLN